MGNTKPEKEPFTYLIVPALISALRLGLSALLSKVVEVTVCLWKEGKWRGLLIFATTCCFFLMSSESLSSAEEYDENEQSVGLISNVMEARAEHLKTRNYRSLYSFTTALGIGTFVMILTWLVKYRNGFAWSSDPNHQFNWHPLLMTSGLIFLYGQSILIYRTGRNSLKKRLKVFHAVLHASAFILAVIGLKAAFDSHNYAVPPKPNLYSLHSWFGLITIILFTGQFVFGFVSFLYPGLTKTLRQAFLPVHTATGVATFILALIAAMTGITEKTIWILDKKYADLPSEGVLCNFIALFLAFFGIFVLYLVNDPDFKRTSLPEDEVALATTD